MIIGDGIMLGAGGETASIFVTGLSETDTVTATKEGNTIAGKWLGSKLNPAYHGLPSGYTEITFIQNSGNANVNLINTGVYWGSISKLEYIINVLSSARDGNIVFSGGSGSTPWLATGGNSGDISGLSHNFVNDGISTDSFSGVIVNNPFCISGWSDDYWTGTYQYKSVKAFNKNNEPIFDGIPCKRNSDSAIGLYDLVSDTFFTNSGTGTFMSGEEIPQYINGFEIAPIKSYGTWVVSNADNTKAADVLIDAAAEFEVTL